ncbi:MAG: ABC transporter substrate-binding protein [Chloroflexota bacterium]|nr:ABC transporter substrate-binding protein [Chloroflexota bacterium]
MPAHRSPSPSQVGFSLGRRGLLKGAAGAAGAAALGLTLPGSAFAQATPTATGELTVGSNYSNEVPKQALHAAIDAFPNPNVTIKLNEVDHNTFQENITTYLQNPDDVLPWFAGYRMRYFAAQGLLGPINDVWDAGLNEGLSEAFKVASTGDDGNLYFVPWTYYNWGIFYRPSLFEEKGWTPPTTMDELRSLASNMQDAGITPFAFGNSGNWPSMGTFDQLNFRMNGYQFHVDLMAGKESWTDERVRAVFTEWESLLPLHQENPNGRKWEEAGAAFANKEAGMMTLGSFVGEVFPEADREDLDFFVWPEMNPEHGTGTVEAPIDGWMMAADPSNPEAAKELLYYFGTAAAQETFLKVNPTVVGANAAVDSSLYSPLQQKVVETISAASNITQFLDRDASPEFAANVAGPLFADFLADPSAIDGILEDMQAQAEAIYAE